MSVPFRFKNGVARVSYNCTLHQEGNHVRWDSESWVYIDTLGHVVETNN